jgi:DNA repair protein RecN (Recombination protein N)
MLTCLRVQGLAVVQNLEVEPAQGLTAVTGETGSGKSILIEALKLVLGARGRAELVRHGVDEAVVEAHFDLTDLPAARARLAQILGRDEDEVVVRRTLRPEGRGRVWINGTFATTAQLGALTAGLVDICSQHEHQSLMDPGAHLSFLDAFARIDAAPTRRAWERCQADLRARDELQRRVAERADREAVVRIQLDEIQALDPRPDEREQLEAEHERLAHGDRLAQLTGAAAAALYERNGAIADHVARVSASLEPLRGIDRDLDPLLDQLRSVRTDLEDVGRELGRYAASAPHDPERLAWIDDRLAAIRRLERRHGGDFAALLARRAALTAELAAMDQLDDALAERIAAADASAVALRAAADQLSSARRAAAERLGGAITQALGSLGMGEARVEVAVADLDARAGGVEVQGRRFTATGQDRAELLIAPNRGEPPRPLARIASGGELSRSLLAIKSVLANEGPRALYVFDEVDVGVGGAIAEAIGRKLRAIAEHQQVLCVTHQPQVAVYGDVHLHIHKRADGERTCSEATRLEGQARLDEVARMMGGLDVSEATRAAAADLLHGAARAARPA